MKLAEKIKSSLPSPIRQWLRDRKLPIERLRRRIGMGPGPSLLRRTTPVNPYDYGESRGQCIDRYYIEKFLTACSATCMVTYWISVTTFTRAGLAATK